MIKGLKFKTPEKDSEELSKFYDLVFDPNLFFASWVGRVGHYPFDREPACSDNQDGYIYLVPCFWQNGTPWKMTADSKSANMLLVEYVEINL